MVKFRTVGNGVIVYFNTLLLGYLDNRCAVGTGKWYFRPSHDPGLLKWPEEVFEEIATELRNLNQDRSKKYIEWDMKLFEK